MPRKNFETKYTLFGILPLFSHFFLFLRRFLKKLTKRIRMGDTENILPIEQIYDTWNDEYGVSYSEDGKQINLADHICIGR